MAEKKQTKKIKVRDLKTRKDPKGGSGGAGQLDLGGKHGGPAPMC